MKFSKLVETVSKKPVPPHVKHLVVEVMELAGDGADLLGEIAGVHGEGGGPDRRRRFANARRRGLVYGPVEVSEVGV